MAFGISFGKKKESGTQATQVAKTEATNQTQTGSQNVSGTTNTTGTSATQTTQTGAQQTSNQQATTGSQTQQQQSTQFSEPVLGALENTVNALLGGIPTQPAQMQGTFDHNAFVSQGTEAAASRIQGDLESTLNSMFDNFGGRDDQNSMAALLANRTRGDAAAQVAGINASLEAQAQDIDKNRFLANLQGTGQQEGFLTQILDALKGGRASATGATQTAENTAGGTQAATQQSGTSTTQQSQSEVMNQITQLLQQLTGTTTTAGTENSKTTGKSGGFGLGLSI
jgi:hypothetical protein